MTLGEAKQIVASTTATWNSGSPEAVATFKAESGRYLINRGELWEGRDGVACMTEEFFADVPDFALVCDNVRIAGLHALYTLTFTGAHSRTGAALAVTGWEEWAFDAEGKITASRGWFDGAEYVRQVEGG